MRSEPRVNLGSQGHSQGRSAGRTLNPYYIVPQGRVTTLTNMKDPERLNLLKEVAGTQVYEARRTESIRIMGETDARVKSQYALAWALQRLWIILAPLSGLAGLLSTLGMRHKSLDH